MSVHAPNGWNEIHRVCLHPILHLHNKGWEKTVFKVPKSVRLCSGMLKDGQYERVNNLYLNRTVKYNMKRFFYIHWTYKLFITINILLKRKLNVHIILFCIKNLCGKGIWIRFWQSSTEKSRGFQSFIFHCTFGIEF